MIIFLILNLQKLIIIKINPTHLINDEQQNKKKQLKFKTIMQKLL
jgi:hypothetical protein